ncbi:MAG: AbrB/MazE/SpoVT family DNA-binding domain-containing protein [Pseudomonadota bacterium]|nr:AbrB/MazE/SpoVT family DNA-binding domain-containing protein [Pseudomonadota bacterium]
MTTSAEQRAAQTLFHLPIGPERRLTLPDELLRQLGVEPGDVVTFSAHAGYALLQKAAADKQPDSVEDDPVPDLDGLLADYFVDHEDVLRFIEEERGGSSVYRRLRRR